jgi:hypothetical protein
MVSGIPFGEGVEVDDSVLGMGDGLDRVDGMTARGFDPRPPDPHRFR